MINPGQKEVIFVGEETQTERSAEEILVTLREEVLKDYERCLRGVAWWNQGRDVGVTGELVGKINQLKATLVQLGAGEQTETVLARVRTEFSDWNGVVRVATENSHVGGTLM